MPNPIQVLMDPVSIIIIVMYAAMILWETLAPARPLPVSRAWRTRGLIAFAIFFYLSTYLPMIWDKYLAPYQLFDLSGLGTAGAALVGLVVYQFGVYWWHRVMHASDTLWLGFHQMHHSAERMDIWGAWYFSPMDMIGWTALGSLALVLVVGLPPQAATAVLLITTWLSIFQHTGVKTPRWLGYFIQRPEQHSVHHAKGIHRFNYSDLPVYDLIFGTFRNPADYEKESGFYPGASERIVDMLLFKDINKDIDHVRGLESAEK